MTRTAPTVNARLAASQTKTVAFCQMIEMTTYPDASQQTIAANARQPATHPRRDM
jgi:hypothetical protein